MIKMKNSLLLGLFTLLIVYIFTAQCLAQNPDLPADAADEQVLYLPLKGETGAYLDRMKTIYNAIISGSIIQETLFTLDKDLEVVSLGAENWEVSDDGKTWTFYLRKELLWSDGKPVTAHDYVFGLYRAVEHGSDLNTYWRNTVGIKNWDPIEKGELPLEELGVRALDDYTLVISTETPKPFMLKTLRFLYPVPQHVVKEFGDEYSTRADTMVGNGPFKVSKWEKGSYLECIKNPNYKGIWKPYLEKIVFKYGTFNPEIGFPAYLNNEIYMSSLNAGQIAYAKNNLADEIHFWPMFRIYYISFDTTKPPFDDLRVRKAFNLVLNRDELCETVLKDLAVPEYSPLVSGFPGHDPFQAKELSEQNIDLAKKLLAEAGYPEGKGFPKTELWLRKADQFAAWQIPATTYLQAYFKKVLNVEIIPQLMEAKTYTDAYNQHTHNLFFATYMFDYLDPSNLMDLFISGGRHAWSNSEYDELVRKADTIQDWNKRVELYRKAEEILIQEGPAVFIFQPIETAVWKPFIKGEGVEPNKNGLISWGEVWDRYVLSHIYISKQ